VPARVDDPGQQEISLDRGSDGGEGQSSGPLRGRWHDSGIRGCLKRGGPPAVRLEQLTRDAIGGQVGMIELRLKVLSRLPMADRLILRAQAGLGQSPQSQTDAHLSRFPRLAQIRRP
jgi:hypothetical protein